MLKVLDDDDRESERQMHVEAAFPKHLLQFFREKRRRDTFCWLYQCDHASSLPVVKFWNWTGNPSWSQGRSSLSPGGMPTVCNWMLTAP